MFVAIGFAGMCIIATLLKNKQKPPQIAPVLIQKMFLSEMREYRKRGKKGGVDVFAEIKKEEKLAQKKRATKLAVGLAKIDGKIGLPIHLGKDNYGKTYTVDLTQMPHLLIGGASGQGKSNLLKCLIEDFGKLPKEIAQLHLVDPKRGLEFRRYKRLDNAVVYKEIDDTPTRSLGRERSQQHFAVQR